MLDTSGSACVIVVGEALVDLVEEEDGRFDPRLGGAARNVAIALARLGTDVQWCWGLGDDRFADRFREEFVAERVGLDHAFEVDAPTALAVVSVGADGSPSYAFHLSGTSSTAVPARALEALPLDEPLHVSLGAVTLATDVVGEHLLGLLARRGAARAMTTLDPNIRPAFLGDQATQRALIEDAAAHCAIVRCSDEDLDLLGGGTVDHDAIVAAWLHAGAAAVVVTRGPDGATVTTPTTTVTRPAPTTTVVDTVGAGDTFGAGMLTALGERGVASRDDVARLSREDWAGVIDLAVRAAAVTVGRRGADPPRRAELG